jgi:uncharacterized membrane protein
VSEGTTKQTVRLEAFSDGVFAIAITLLVLELRPPEDGDLLRGLLHLWPSYLSFALSFVTILIMWTNHHANLAHVERVDGHLLFANGFLLLFITFVPFPTAVLAAHLGGAGARTAAAFYALTYVGINVAWLYFWRTISRSRATIAPGLTAHEVRAVTGALLIGFVSYATATLVSWVSAAAGISLCMALAAFWTWQAMRHHGATHAHEHGRPDA